MNTIQKLERILQNVEQVSEKYFVVATNWDGGTYCIGLGASQWDKDFLEQGLLWEISDEDLLGFYPVFQNEVGMNAVDAFLQIPHDQLDFLFDVKTYESCRPTKAEFIQRIQNYINTLKQEQG